MYRRSAIVTVAMAATLALSGPVAATDGWQAIRAASARYHSFALASAHGYSIESEPCVSAPPGTMGIHAVNRGLTADLDIVPTQPEILLYIPTTDGKLKLVGVEYFAVALANSASGPIPWFDEAPPAAGWFNPAPQVLGQTFDGPMPGHNPQMPWHYDKHVWVVEQNPAGIFAQFNPAVSC